MVNDDFRNDLIELSKKITNFYKISESVTFHKKDWDDFYNKYTQKEDISPEEEYYNSLEKLRDKWDKENE